MWSSNCLVYWISSMILASHTVFGTEFTFDLADSIQECFYEMVKEGVECSLDYQVVGGGALDIDVSVLGPAHNVIYHGQRKEYDNVQFNTTLAGEYKICLSNEFSTFTHKSVYLSFEAGNEHPTLKGIDEHYKVMTFMEATSDEMHNSLNDVIDAQTHYRLQEHHGRRFAEDLNERVLWWSLAQTIVIFAIGISQVLILRNFFSDSKPINRPLVVPSRQPRFGYTS